MSPLEHAREAERLLVDAATWWADDDPGAAGVLAQMATAHATLAQTRRSIRVQSRPAYQLIRQAISDPAAFVAREEDTDGNVDELHAWQAKAVLAALTESTSGEGE